MQSKHSLMRYLLIGILAIAIASALLFFLRAGPSAENVYTSARAPSGNSFLHHLIGSIPSMTKGAVALPVRLKIPRIGADAHIEHVGITPEGAMAVPAGPDNVAWFELGVRPGEVGSAVIAGHEGWKNGIAAVFDNLHTMQKGDTVTVEDAKGITTTFVVRELRTYGENEDATGVFGSEDGLAHLNLVTCQGVWNKTNKSYASRLVVFTDKLE